MLSPRPLRSAAVVPAGVLAGSLSESEASRRVYLAAGGIALLGLLLLVGTVWWWRSTRNEHPSLAPLEVMGARRWRKASEPERQRLVDGVRPEGAETGPAVIEPEPVDLAALAVGDHAGFDDLREIDELLGLDVEQLLALKPQPTPTTTDGPDVEVAGAADEPPAEAHAVEVDEADEVDVEVDDEVDDETVAIAPDDPDGAAEGDVEPDGGGPDSVEADDEQPDDDGPDDDEPDDDQVIDEAAVAPGDPLLERSAND